MLLRKLNEWSRPDFKFGPFKKRDEMHLVVLWGEVIRMYCFLSLKEKWVEFEFQGHREEFHQEGVKAGEDNRGLPAPAPRVSCGYCGKANHTEDIC